MLLPLQSDFDIPPYTQGNALGYVHFGLSCFLLTICKS